MRLWAVISLAIGLQVSGCASGATEPSDWQASLSEIAKTELSDAVAKHDTLTASWAGELATLNNLPFASTLTLAEVKRGFITTPTVRQIEHAGMRWSSEIGENWVLTSQTHGKSPSHETAAL